MLDTGPILRLDDLGNPLPKSARYGDPSERPRFGSALSAAEMADTCVGFFRTGLKVGRGGVRRFDPMVDEWTWEEVERLNDEAFAGWK